MSVKPLRRSTLVMTLAVASVMHGLAAAAPKAAPAPPRSPQPAVVEHATFAGGCFWCMESPFESLPGVRSVTSGYSGGAEKNPTYSQVSSGSTGHAEAVDI
ncbi:MAG TPA: peptide-methionine (S)-S-oxide reductase, partial [Candidatus Eisenbacteria bacterium]|nr:peptide-methionine (S)-S-oxide reductase [Candidatus Eisenbacteria bacterium]